MEQKTLGLAPCRWDVEEGFPSAHGLEEWLLPALGKGSARTSLVQAKDMIGIAVFLTS